MIFMGHSYDLCVQDLVMHTLIGTVLSVDVTIVTNPRQGPFRLRQQYQFSCVVEPTPPEPVTYQWRYIEEAYSSSTTGQTFNRTYYYSYTNHYCYYFCEVSANQTLIGSAKRIIEVQGNQCYEEVCMISRYEPCRFCVHRRASCSEFQ